MHATQRAFAPFMIEHAPESRLGVLVTPSTPYETKKRGNGEPRQKMLHVTFLIKTHEIDFGRFRPKVEIDRNLVEIAKSLNSTVKSLLLIIKSK